MSNKTIITGVSIKEQMRRADLILNKVVIPRDNEFKKRKTEGTLSSNLKKALLANA